jgi:HEAT repeat protein
VAAIRARHSGWNVRRHAVAILSRHGRQHKPAAAALIEMLEHPSQGMWDCSQQAVEILISLKAAKKAVPILARWLTSTNRGVSRRAAQALGKIGKDAAAAIPALREMAEKDPERRNRDFARKVLEQIEAAGRDKTPGKKPN